VNRLPVFDKNDILHSDLLGVRGFLLFFDCFFFIFSLISSAIFMYDRLTVGMVWLDWLD